MKVLDELTIKTLLLNKKRSIVTIIGIILSVALITAVSSMVVSFRESLIDYEKNKNGDYHYSFAKVKQDEIKEFKNNRYIESYELVEDIGYSRLENSQNNYKPYIKILGIDSSSYKSLGIELIEGTYPKKTDEIVIPRHLKTNARVEYKVGDTITLNIGKRMSGDYELTQNNPYDSEIKEELKNITTKEYKIVGIIERPADGIEPYTAPGYTMITMPTNNKDNYYTIYARYTKKGLKNQEEVTVNIIRMDEKLFKDKQNLNPNNIDEYEEAYNNSKYETTNHGYLIALETNTFGDGTMKALGLIATIVIIIVIVTSVFCIKNSFNISITEKIKDYGMLSSIGATSKQIKKSVYHEAFILGIIGIPIGIISGILAAYTLIIIVNKLLSSADMIVEGFLIFKTSFIAIILSILLSTITIYLSSRKGAKIASKTSPITAIRGNNEIKITSKKVKSPKYISKLFGVGGDISYKTIKRNKKKYRTTVISIIVCVSVYIALSYFINTAFRAIKLEYGEYSYNLSLYSFSSKENYNEDYNNFIKVSKLDNIKKYSLVRTSPFEVKGIKFTPDAIKYAGYTENDQETIISLLSVGKEEYLRYLKELNLSYDNVKDKIILINNSISESEENNYKKIEYDLIDIKNGETLNGKIGTKNYSIEVAKVTNQRPLGYENYYGTGLGVISDEFIENLDKNDSIQMFIESNDADKLQDDIDKIIKKSPNSDYSVTNVDANVKSAQSLYTVVAIFLYGFIIVIALIGVTNIFNTITTSISLRRREFATLKSVGMTSKEFNRMIFLESFFYCTKSLIIGIPIGIGLSCLFYIALTNRIGIKYTLPYKGIIISIIIVFILIFTLMKYSVNKLKDNNIIETIRNENI